MSPSVESDVNRSGGRLGGISTMVTQADVCPSCGGHHEGRRRPFWDRAGRLDQACPIVVHGPFPVLMKVPEPTQLVLEFPFDSEPRPETGPTAASESTPPAMTRRLGQLPIPWPAPSFDEAYL